jgi:hypothetical protein
MYNIYRPFTELAGSGLLFALDALVASFFIDFFYSVSHVFYQLFGSGIFPFCFVPNSI